MLRKYQSKCATALAALIISLAPVGAAAQANCPSNPEQSATFTLSGATVAFIAGYRWGEGVLTLNNGQEFPFTARGWKLGESGTRGADIKGEIYGMESLDQFVGHYRGAGGNVTLIVGEGDIHLVNSECVSIVGRYISGGMRLSLPTDQKITVQLTVD
jgi:hypothetical protein